MRVKVLGSAAGGGFPQWNCACRNCNGIRERTLNASARSQCQIAISSNNEDWFLLNASPDLRSQIESTPVLQSRPNARAATILPGRMESRHTPIVGVVLTGGDLDQVLGLLLLRELEPIHVYSTASVRHLLRDCNIFFNMLSRQPGQSVWTDIRPGERFRLANPDSPSYMECQPVTLPGFFPAYVDGKVTDFKSDEAVLGLVIESSHGGGRLGYFPTVAAVGDQLLELFESCDLLLFDGTFWTDDELLRLERGFGTATEMGHLAMSGRAGSLNRLAKLRRPRKIFLHINNTNPVLERDSPEHRQVIEAGWEVAEDGWEFKLPYLKQARAS